MGRLVFLHRYLALGAQALDAEFIHSFGIAGPLDEAMTRFRELGESGVEFVRVVDDEATLLVTAEDPKTTGFEAWRPMLEDLGAGNSWEWLVASATWADEWSRSTQYPFLNMSESCHGTPDEFPNATTPWPATDGERHR